MSKRGRIPLQNVPASKAGTALYTKREAIHVKHITGIFQKLRDATLLLTLGVYFLLPWVQWDGRQAVLFDLPRRQFHIFNITFWPQDFYFLAAALMVAAFSLFFMTVLAGRVWCGYTCPQTTWTRLFMTVERWFEGDRNQRLKRDRSSKELDTILRRGGKYIVWLIIAFFTGLAFVGYFTPIRELVPDLFTGQANFWAWFWIGAFTVATFGNAGILREQVCLYMCPYARFQSVMFDKDTLIVTYDEKRGEPRRRGTRKRKDAEMVDAGDCIDCSLCVQVCPTGIDIRDGLQYECIACAACIDACDEVMVKVGRPKGLIRYTTERGLEGGKTHWLRPRLIGYGIAITLIIGFFSAQLLIRTPLQVDVLRDRHELYRTTSEGFIENSYRLEILNKDQAKHQYQITLDAPKGLELINAPILLELEGGQGRSIPVTVSYDPYLEEINSSSIKFIVTPMDNSHKEVKHESRFIAPN